MMLASSRNHVVVSMTEFGRLLPLLGAAVVLLGLTSPLVLPSANAQAIVDDDGTISKQQSDVDCDGTGTNVPSSVETAVDDGAEEVQICPGTYGPDEEIVIKNDIEIKAIGSGEAVIESQADGSEAHAIRFTEAENEITESEIKGFTIKHSDGSGGSGATIVVEDGVEGTTIQNVTIVREGGLSAGGSAIKGGTDVTVADSDITGGPIGFYGDPSGNYTVRNTTIRGARDEGIWIVDANTLTLTGNTIEKTADGNDLNDRLGVAVYNVETELVLHNNNFNATEAPLLLGNDLPVDVHNDGNVVTVADATNLRALLGTNTINSESPGKATFVAETNGTLRNESNNVSSNNGDVHVVRTTITSAAGSGGSDAYDDSALDAAQAGDVVHLTDGSTYAETVTLAQNLGFETPGSASITALNIDGSYVVDAIGSHTLTNALTTGTDSELTGDPLVLGSNATLTDNGLVNGTLKATRTVSDGETVAFGNIGLTLTTTGGSTPPGQTTVTRTDGDPVTVGVGSIDRRYDVDAATSSGLDVDIDVHYKDGDDGGDDELTTASVSDDGALGVFRSPDGDNSWSQLTTSDSDINNDVYTVSGLSSLSQFTLAEAGGTLPVNLAGLTGSSEGTAAVLTWTTAAETNNAGFRVQRKTGSGYETIDFVDGSGTTTETNTYRHRVPELEYGTHTFRLEQVDRDGSTTLSEDVQVEITLDDAFAISDISPNPLRHRGQLKLTVRETQDVSLVVYDQLGRRVARVHEGPLQGETTHRFPVQTHSLASGQYFLRVVGTDFQTTRRFVVVR